MKPLNRNLVSATALPLLLVGTVMAHAATAMPAATSAALPPVHQASGIDYLTGGIGKDESKAMEQAAAHWPLMLEFSQKAQHKDAFTADVAVHVRDTHGHSVLQLKSEGPLLLARLKPGHYRVEATLAGKTIAHDVSVKHGHTARLDFVWPEGPHAS